MTAIGTRKAASPAQVHELERILQRQPGSRFFASLAEAYVAEGRAAEALALAEKGVGLHPDFARGRIALALALDALGRGAEAEAALVPLGQATATAADGYVALGQARLARGDRVAARRFAQTAAAMQPSNREALTLLADLAEGGGGGGGGASTESAARAGAEVEAESESESESESAASADARAHGAAAGGTPAGRTRGGAGGRGASPEDPPLLSDTSTFPPWAAVPAGVVGKGTFRSAPSYSESEPLTVPPLDQLLTPRAPGDRPLRLPGGPASPPRAAGAAPPPPPPPPSSASGAPRSDADGPGPGADALSVWDETTVTSSAGGDDFEDVDVGVVDRGASLLPPPRTADQARGTAPSRAPSPGRGMTMPPPAPVATGRSAARSPGAGGAPRAATAEAVVISTQPGSPAEPTTFVRDVPAHDAAAPGRRSRTGALVVAVVAGVVLAGGGFAAWRWREALLALVGAGDGADGSAKGTDKGEGGDGRGKGDAKGKGGGGVDGDGRSGDPGSAASGSAAPGEPGGGAVAAGDPSDRAAITALLAEGRAAEALARLSTAGVKDPGTRGLALAAAGKPGEAIPLLAEALGAKGDDAAVAIALVGAYLSAGDAARAATTAAALPAPLRDQANGLVAFARGDLKRAVKLLRKTARAGAPWAQTTLALALLASGDSGAALEVLGPARKAAPAAVDLAAAEALALARAGKTGAARKAAAALAARTPPITSGSSLRMVADALLAAGDSKGALDMAERAAATTPADVAALLTLGRAAAAAGDTAKAAEAYGRAAKAAPEDAAVLAGWARALLARGDADGAAAAAAKAYTLAPAMIEAQLAQCEALVAGGKAAAATKMLKTLLKDARGGDDEAAVQLVAGKAYAARGKKGVAKALDAYARALELRESAEGHYLTGQALELKGAAGKKKAAAAYARAVALDDHYAPAHLALGLLLARGKKPPPAARASLEAYLALDPAGAGAADARAALAKLPK